MAAVAEPIPTTIDPSEVEAFAGQMLGIINGGATALLVGIGHQTGLFDAMASLPASSSEVIAEAAGLNERYVREWLSGLALARIVEYDATAKTFRLPPAHAAMLTRAAGPDNLAFVSQYIAALGAIEQQVAACFRNGGGVPYAALPRFQALQAEESGAVLDASLLQRTIPSVPGLVAQLEAGIDVADIGCGSGHALNLMARAYPKSRFTGFDISEEGVGRGRAEAAAWGLANVRFDVQDVAKLSHGGEFDFITAFDSIHDQAAPRTVLTNIRRALRPGGTFLLVDIAASSTLEENLDHPLGPALFAFSVFHCMTVSLAAGGEGLGSMWGEQRARGYLTDAGFDVRDSMHIEGDILNVYYIAQ